MLIYIITAGFTFLALLFWAKWVNVSKDLKKSKQDKINGDLATNKELKRLNFIIKTISDIEEREGNIPISKEFRQEKTVGAILITKICDYYNKSKNTIEDKDDNINDLSGALKKIRKEFNKIFVNKENIDLVSYANLVVTRYQENNKEITRLITKNSKQEETFNKSLHVAHQTSYKYRKKLIKAGWLKPRKAKVFNNNLKPKK